MQLVRDDLEDAVGEQTAERSRQREAAVEGADALAELAARVEDCVAERGWRTVSAQDGQARTRAAATDK